MLDSQLLNKTLLKSPLLWIFIAATAFYFWLINGVPIVANPGGIHDDAHFVTGAFHILHGRWLGPYNEITLIKGPFYSIFIALNFIFRIPLFITQGFLYWASGIIVFSSIYKIFGRRNLALIGFIAFLFNPMITNSTNLRVLREDVYVPFFFFFAGGMLWSWLLRNAEYKRRVKLNFTLGFLLFCLLTTREEGVWIIPGAALAILSIAFFNVKECRPDSLKVILKREIVLIGILVATAWSGVQMVKLLNYLNYEQPVVTELSTGNPFLSAYAAMTRVIVEAPIDRVPVSRKTFAEMARYSPALAEIQPIVYFPGGWEVYLCDKTDTTQCEIKGGWFMFAVRDAVAKRGYYKDAPSANAFYTRVRDELESACTSGKLTCLPFGTSIYPVFRGSDVVKTLGAFMRGMQSVLFFEPFGLSERELSSQGNDSELHAFLNLTRSLGRTFPRDRSVLDILATIHRFYGDGFAWLSLIFLVLFTVVRIKKWDFPPALFSILSIFGVTLVTRIVVFSYVDVTLFPAFGSNYLSPCYPCAIVLIFSLISSVKSPV